MTLTVFFASLWMSFANPPESAKPWCYWWWVNGNVDEETISEDLESIKNAGFGGILLFDPRGYNQTAVWQPPPKMPFAGEEWILMGRDPVQVAVSG